MKIRLWWTGLTIFLAVAGPPQAGGAPLSTAVDDVPAVRVLRLNSLPPDGVKGNLLVQPAAGDVARKYLRMLKSRGDRARRQERPDQPRLGVDDLIGFAVDADRYGNSGINIRFNLDRRQRLDWMRFWTDFSLSPESEQSLDYSAIAQAAYTPEIRYWLYGARWASFDTALPRLGKAATVNSAIEAGTGAGASASTFTAARRENFAVENGSSTAAPKIKRGQFRATSLRDFLLSMGSKIIRQPIVYVILLVILAILFANTRRRSLN